MSRTTLSPSDLGPDTPEDPVCADGFRSSGPSPTLHVRGAGPVARAFVASTARECARVVAWSDSRGTVFASGGLDCPALLLSTKDGRGPGDLPGASPIGPALLHRLVAIDAVVDCTSTRPADAAEEWPIARSLLERGTALVLASKHLAQHDPAVLLDCSRVGLNAVLGGTGRALLDERDELAARAVAVSAVPNATSSAVLDALGTGANFAAALDEARRRGLLEADESLDLDGLDAALKLRVVASAVLGVDLDPRCIERRSLRDVDPRWVAEETARGRCVRLVARADRFGGCRVVPESLPRGSSLATTSHEVAYQYHLADGSRRLHLGRGLGAERVAEALWVDVRALLGAGVLA